MSDLETLRRAGRGDGTRIPLPSPAALAEHTRNFDHNKYFEALRAEPVRVDGIWPSVNRQRGR